MSYEIRKRFPLNLMIDREMAEAYTERPQVKLMHDDEFKEVMEEFKDALYANGFWDILRVVIDLHLEANKQLSIFDAEGNEWRWNGERVYMVEAELEYIKNGDDPAGNGYQASSWEEAIRVLNEGDYMEKED